MQAEESGPMSTVEDSDYSGSVEEDTEAPVENDEISEEQSTEGLFMRKIVEASGAHIVRDSWCLVNESNNCIPAL